MLIQNVRMHNKICYRIVNSLKSPTMTLFTGGVWDWNISSRSLGENSKGRCQKVTEYILCENSAGDPEVNKIPPPTHSRVYRRREIKEQGSASYVKCSKW